MNLSHTEHITELPRGDDHRPGRRCTTGTRLRKCSRQRRMKRDVSLDLLQCLVNVSVEYGHRAESLEIPKRSRAIVSSPPPFGVDAPQGNVREDDDRCAARKMAYVALDPGELLFTERSKSACLQIQDIYQSEKMHAAVIEAVPAAANLAALSAFAVAIHVARSAIDADVVFSRNKERLPRF